MTNEELEHGSFEIENRIRNLMWTISGDYDLDTKPDVTSFYKSKYISIYDAIKQGAFSRFFDKDAFALYLLKKVYLGADESQLVTLGQICVEAACHDKIAKERPGVPDIRKKAFEAIMDHDFEKMLDTYTGKVKLAYMREALTGSAPADSRVIRPFAPVPFFPFPSQKKKSWHLPADAASSDKHLPPLLLPENPASQSQIILLC